MSFEFLPVVGLLYAAVLGLYYEISISKSLQRLEGKEILLKVVKRFMLVAITLHVYAIVYFLTRLIQFYFNQRSNVYFLFDALMLFVLLLLPVFAQGAMKSIKHFEAME